MEALQTSKQNYINVGPTGRWLSVISGTLLAYMGIRRRSTLGKMAMEGTAGYLFYRGVTGHCPVSRALGISGAVGEKEGTTVEKTIRIQRSPEEVYNYWRNFENLPSFMEHLESVNVIDEKRSHWVVRTPAGIKMEWNSEMLEDVKNEFIAWRSLPDSDIDNEGSVRFSKSPSGGETELTFKMTYYPPTGVAGLATSEFFRDVILKKVEQNLMRFKEIMEREVSVAGV